MGAVILDQRVKGDRREGEVWKLGRDSNLEIDFFLEPGGLAFYKG